MKTLFLMSIYGSVMIIFIIILRTLFIYKLPKKLFKTLWILAVCRLIIPFWIDISISNLSNNTEGYIDKQINDYNIDFEDLYSSVSRYGNTVFDNVERNCNAVTVIWGLGFALIALYFVVVGYYTVKKLKQTEPIYCTEIFNYIKSFPIKRRICVELCEKVKSPLTVGVFKPKILLPKSVLNCDVKELKAVLSHELIHIKNNDIFFKFVAIVILCIHWFNPFVWVMFKLFDRDIELTCDEEVLKECCIDRKLYAMTLINFKERQSFSALTNNFAKNLIEERIKAIMKNNFKTKWVLPTSTVILFAVIFAFSAKVYGSNSKAIPTSLDSTIKIESEFEKENSDKNEAIDIEESLNTDNSVIDVILPDQITSLPQDEYIYGNDAQMYLQRFFGKNFSNPLKGSDEEAVYYGAFEIESAVGENIYSMSDGVVLYSNYDPIFGNALVIDHGDENVFLYANCNDVTVVEGDNVSSGDLVGHVGESGFTPNPRLLIYKLTK